MPSDDKGQKAPRRTVRKRRIPSTPAAVELEARNAPLKPNVSLNRSWRMGAPTEDEELLKRPPAPPGDFTRSDTWRVLRIMGEFVEGFDTLATLGAAVTIFGSARITEDDPMYWQVVELASRLSEAGFAIVTGGGPGVMEAGNRGAREVGGVSVGCNIELPFEQGTNAYVDISINFRYFFVRKVMFMKYSEAFVIFPGGFGTMDELFEALTLIQTGKVRNFPVILFGSDYWRGLVDWIDNTMLQGSKISPQDLKLLIVTDSVEEAVTHIVDCYNDRCWQQEGITEETRRIHAELLDDPGDLYPTAGNGQAAASNAGATRPVRTRTSIPAPANPEAADGA